MQSDGDLPTRHGQPQLLDFDILRLLCDYLTDVTDVISLALTCSELTETSFRRRLKMAPVNLWDAKSVDRFHAFIFSNQAARAPYIYGLKLPGPYIYDSPLVDKWRLESHVLALLEAAVHIQSLDLPTSARASFFDAAMKLTTLRTLSVCADDGRAPLCVRLTAVRSPLRSLSVTEGSFYLGDQISAHFLHHSLGHLAPTLQVLELDFFFFTIRPSEVTTPFLAVRSLKLRRISSVSSNCLGVLLRLFPKLDNKLTIGSWDTRAGEEAFPAIQERSREAQSTHGTWPGIDHLVCDPRTALLLALQCPIRRMSTKVIWPRAWKYLADALRHNAPRQLHVAVELDAGFGALDGLFPPEAAGTLTHLVMSAHFGVKYRRGAQRKPNNVHWDRFTDRLLHSIQHLRLTHLRIVFRASVHYSARTPPRHDELPELLQTACGVDLLPAAARFVNAMPSLQCLFLTACGHTYVVPIKARWEAFQRQALDSWLSSGAWRVVHNDSESQALPPGGPSDVDVDATGSRSYVELSREAVERVMDREELRLSREEEDKIRRCGQHTGS